MSAHSIATTDGRPFFLLSSFIDLEDWAEIWLARNRDPAFLLHNVSIAFLQTKLREYLCHYRRLFVRWLLEQNQCNQSIDNILEMMKSGVADFREGWGHICEEDLEKLRALRKSFVDMERMNFAQRYHFYKDSISFSREVELLCASLPCNEISYEIPEGPLYHHVVKALISLREPGVSLRTMHDLDDKLTSVICSREGWRRSKHEINELVWSNEVLFFER